MDNPALVRIRVSPEAPVSGGRDQSNLTHRRNDGSEGAREEREKATHDHPASFGGDHSCADVGDRHLSVAVDVDVEPSQDVSVALANDPRSAKPLTRRGDTHPASLSASHPSVAAGYGSDPAPSAAPGAALPPSLCPVSLSFSLSLSLSLSACA